MIPVTLHVRNFMCYRSAGETLELDGVHLACLSGENGAGKSALLGAITWALWGKAREGVSDDDSLISLGAVEMEVDYEFILGDCRYRVVRKRSKKSGGSTILELHMQGADEDDGWKPITGHHVRDTQAKINNLLKMEYDTFTNSAFLLQGRADAFMLKGPTGRKEVLARILGLEQYDKLEERAKEEARDRKARLNELEMQIKTIDTELLKRPEYDRQLKEIEADLEQTQVVLATAREELDGLTSEKAHLEGAEARMRELQVHVQKLKDDMQLAQSRLAEYGGRKSELIALLSQREEIGKGYLALQAAQAEDRRFNESIAALRDLEREENQARQAIEVSRVGLAKEKQQYERDIKDLEASLAARPDVQRRLDVVEKKLGDLGRLQLSHEDNKCKRETLDVRIRTLQSEKEAAEKEGKTLKQKLDLLHAAHAQGHGKADCPLCGTGLTADALERVRLSYEGDIEKKRNEYTAKVDELKIVNKEFADLDAQIDREKTQLKETAPLQSEKARHEAALLQLDEKRERLAGARANLVQVKKELEEEDYAHEARKALLDVENRVKTVGYDEAAHAAARDLVAQLEEARYSERYHQLEGAQSQLEMVTSTIERDERSIAGWEAEQDAGLKEIESLRPQAEQLVELRDAIAVKRSVVNGLAVEVGELTEHKGELRGKLDHCDALQEEKQHKMAEHKSAGDEKLIYDDLTTAFGKKGIQAMIIENILPELEEEANQLLDRMTDGRMSVQFSTQRDAKTTRSVIETLDINIADEMGTRAYELYSGGEAYRVNFAVRIALSKLLARRAGAQLQMLVIDEGFGTQDGQGRDRLVSAIRSIQEDFERILVVTHIEELKNEFPVRIDVVKDDTGSRIVVN